MLAREMRLFGPSSSRPCPEKAREINSNPLTVKYWDGQRVSNRRFFAQYRDCAAKLGLVGYCAAPLPMLMLRSKPPESWLSKVLANLDAVLVDHAHLERKAAQSALKLQRYQQLAGSLPELTEIAIEELEHFNFMLKDQNARANAMVKGPRTKTIKLNQVRVISPRR